MGRKKGSKNKPKTFTCLQELGKAMEEGMKEANLLPSTDKILPGPIGSVTYQDGTASEILQTKSDYQKGSLTMTLGPRKPIEEKPYPSNWNELGKVAKLQWLTEHRK